MSSGESGVLVIADDLSGAAEVAATLDPGTPIVLTASSAESATGSGDTIAEANAGAESDRSFAETVDTDPRDLVVDLDCRYLTAESAGARTSAALRDFGSPRATLVKVDSLLRGNIRAALTAALGHASGPVIFAPALPQQSRTVVGGVPFDNGIRLSSTRAWSLENGSAPETLSDLCPVPARHLGLDELRLLPGSDAADVFDDAADSRDVAVSSDASIDASNAGFGGERLITADAESMEDLTRIVTLAEATSAILVGTSALARALAECRRGGLTAPSDASAQADAGDAAEERPDPSSFPRTPARVLTLLGTAAERIETQIAHLRDHSDTRVLDFPATAVAAWADDPHRLGDSAVRVREALAESHLVVRLTDTGASVDPRPLPGLLAELATRALSGFGPVALAAAGGETARAVFDRLGVHRIEAIREIHPGAVLSTVETASASIADDVDFAAVVTRPGGQGGPDSLTLIHAALTTGEPTTTTAATVANHEGESMNALPTVAVTMGDGAGVGPEICIAACLDPSVLAVAAPVVIGDAARLERAAQVLGTTVEIRAVDSPADAEHVPGVINVIDLALLPGDLPWGELSPVAGDAAFRYIERASQLAMSGEVQAICTAPLNKEALHSAGHKYPGHTEMLASLTGTEEVSMMLSSPKLRVIHVTTHIGLIDAVAKIEPGLVERTVRRGHDALVRAGLERPHIGVCAINPHAGENGLFGYGEEEEKITPAITKLQAEGIDAVGPLPADTAFFLAGRGDYDLIVAMYHDQGHGPIKVLGIDAGVNITVGLPVIRTSVDHGTAFDIAGTGKVDTESMSEAMRQAAALAVV
ncbi:4-hydroxythreonine-4-phosphate dehydrogenase PdxA [Brevibacterium permense]|uniref:4-hydroxythreonine-4-phosphate dehydrogenase PdxA n=1 Tax=Brevibacterium permense TaxID=234834 RepID=UPI0021CE5C9C|nr:4-hydroxythreonine-4-phosphate dehydrogenase PdxA [Brevibacterium permense]MCU4298543.1 4-hydroxythreonine-4-phosphate dehydrogenase PdxA [Brevibacterium permense]